MQCPDERTISPSPRHPPEVVSFMRLPGSARNRPAQSMARVDVPERRRSNELRVAAERAAAHDGGGLCAKTEEES